mgnify:CR=1 FL=1
MAQSPSGRRPNTVNTGSSAPDAAPMGINSGRYHAHKATREPYLERARSAAELTIPFLFRPEGDNGSTEVEVPWNSLGAYLVSNLGSKMALGLFPPGRPAFKAKQGRTSLADLESLPEEERETIRLNIDTGLSRFEQEVTDGIEEDGDASRLNVAILKMIVGGNHGFQFYPDGSLRGISLEHMVTYRDPSGALLEFIVEDVLAWETLPELVRQECLDRGYKPSSDVGVYQHNSMKVYTRGILRAGMWTVTQEVYGFEVSGSRSVVKPEVLPFFFVPFELLDGEHYGRSYVEKYLGDLQTVEGLTQTIVEGSAAAAVFLRLVNPTGLTLKKAIAEARNGDVLSGRAEDVTTLQGNKSADFQTAEAAVQRAVERLSRAFLLNSAVQRGGERVTAEEIRFVAQELDDILGGVYSQQAISFQSPYLKLKIYFLQKQKRVSALPKNSVNFTILTGKAALGRNAELAALDSLIGPTMQLFGPQETLKALGSNFIREYVQKRATALGVSIALPSEDEAAAMDQAAQQQALIQQLGPEAVRQVGGNITANSVAATNSQARVDAAQAASVSPIESPPQAN